MVELATKEYVDSKDLVVKTFDYISNGSTYYQNIGTIHDIGLNYEKMVVAPFVRKYNSIPSNKNFFVNLYLEYGQNLILYTNVSQAIMISIAWIERK